MGAGAVSWGAGRGGPGGGVGGGGAQAPKGADLLKPGQLAGLQGRGVQHQHRAQVEDVTEELVVLGAEGTVSPGRSAAPERGPRPAGLPTWRWWCMPDPSTSLKAAYTRRRAQLST